MLSNATVPVLGAVDTAVIGQLGDVAALGAVEISAVILATRYWAFGLLRMSTSGLAAQAEGAGDKPERLADRAGTHARAAPVLRLWQNGVNIILGLGWVGPGVAVATLME